MGRRDVYVQCFSLPEQKPLPHADKSIWRRPELEAGKRTLWTNAGQDRNFQTTLSAIGPYEFQGKFIWTNHWSIPFPGEIRMDQWSWKFYKSFPLHWYWSMDGSSQWGGEPHAVMLQYCVGRREEWVIHNHPFVANFVQRSSALVSHKKHRRFLPFGEEEEYPFPC